jgi:hypothetical protein
LVKRNSESNITYNPSELVLEFMNATDNAFSFLSSWPGFMHDFKVQVLTPNGFKQVRPDEVKSFFFAESLFITKVFTVTISYGDRELYINTLVRLHKGQDNSRTEYALWQWLKVLGFENQPATSGDWVITLERIREIVNSAATVLKTTITQISEADHHVLKALKEIVQQIIIDEQLRMKKEALKTKISTANDAFHAKDFNKVVSILEPIKDDLPESQMKKLLYALGKLKK